jgi:hypothetical protein
MGKFDGVAGITIRLLSLIERAADRGAAYTSRHIG